MSCVVGAMIATLGEHPRGSVDDFGELFGECVRRSAGSVAAQPRRGRAEQGPDRRRRALAFKEAVDLDFIYNSIEYTNPREPDSPHGTALTRPPPVSRRSYRQPATPYGAAASLP